LRPEAVRIIRDEHVAISAVLYLLRKQAQQVRANAADVDFTLLRAILDYIVSYPERWHHPKEDKFLFRAIRRRTREADKLIAALEKEHRQGLQAIEALKASLVELINGSSEERARFPQLAEAYFEFEWTHMRQEEDVLMPIAERHLTAADWEEIGAAFRENDNPLFGIKPKDEAQRLYRTILQACPPGEARSAT